MLLRMQVNWATQSRHRLLASPSSSALNSAFCVLALSRLVLCLTSRFGSWRAKSFTLLDRRWKTLSSSRLCVVDCTH
jgi:hypothetical protein